MARKIGVRELKNQTSRVLRTIREEMAEYVVTLRGEPVALLRPLTEDEAERLQQDDIAKAMAEMKTLAEEIGAAWSSDKSAVELVSEQRR